MNLSIFDMLYPKYKITKPVRLIELFAGYGSQALALKYLGVKFEHWKICEWAVKSIQAYKDIHFTDKKLNGIDIDKLKEQDIKDYLYEKGISSNYNEPMTKQQIDRLSYDNVKKIIENIYITHNLVNIQQVKGKDLDIVDRDKYDYILTYSFPCQDLSLAGKGKGMSDTSTRSGMLWEVERILTECHKLGSLPQILLMENVPQVHGADNLKDFNKWQLRLEELGYKNYMQDLIATDYGIPQTRNRCFMISILGDYSYTFPKPIPLKLKLKDMLEDNVDEKYYLSDKMINFFTKNEEKQKENGNGFRFNVSDGNAIAKTITTRAGSRMDDNFIKIKNNTKKGYLEATDGDGIDISSRMEHHRGTVQKGKAQTLTTQCDRGVLINKIDIRQKVKVRKYEIDVSNLKKILKKHKKYSNKEISLKLNIPITTVEHWFRNDNSFSIPDANIWYELKELLNIQTNEFDESITTFIEKDNLYEKNNRFYFDNGVAPTLTATSSNEKIISNLKIRKLTPKECFRLMGVKDDDFEKVRKNQSDSSLYHLAGDSIVVNVLMAIFKELLIEEV